MKLDYRRTIIVGLAFMTISGFWQLYDFTIPLMLKEVFSVSDSVAGIVMSLDNILALILMPTFGALSDKVSTKYGKRMPFIVLGTLITSSSMMLLPTAAKHQSILLFVVGLGVVLLAVAMYRSPAVALMPDITIKPLRSKGNAIINLLGTVGGMVALGFISFFKPSESGSYMPLFLAFAIFMILAVVVMIFTVKENKWTEDTRKLSIKLGLEEVDETGSYTKTVLDKDVKRSLTFFLFAISAWFMGYNAVISAFSRYAVYEINLTTQAATLSLQLASIGALVSFLPIGVLSSKIGRKRTIQIGVIVLAFAFGTATIYRQFNVLMYGNFLLAGFGWAAINVNSLPMVLEMAKGSDIGKFTGLYYTFSMSAQVVTPILSGFLFDFIGYRILFPYAAFFLVVSYVMVNFVHHGDSKLENYKDVLLEEDL